MEPSVCINIVVGCPSYLHQLPEGPCLVVDVDQSRLAQLMHPEIPADHPWGVDVHCAALSQSSGEPIVWHRFSDSRFDGVDDPETVLSMYPNLEHLESQTLEGVMLASVLHQTSLGLNLSTRIQLYLCQGDPLSALMGAGHWLNNIDGVYVRTLDFVESKLPEFHSAVSGLGFYHVVDDPRVWRPLKVELSKAEFDSLKQTEAALKQSQASHKQSEAALKQLFPYDFYRSLRPDLDHLNDDDLVRHFCDHGLDEGLKLESGVEFQYVMEALRKVFPYQYYRKLCPDLSGLNDRSLLLFYCQNHLSTDLNLSETAVCNYAGSFPVSEVEFLRVKVQRLEKLLAAMSSSSLASVLESNGCEQQHE